MGNVSYLDGLVETIRGDLRIANQVPVVCVTDDGCEWWILATRDTGNDGVGKSVCGSKA